MQTGVHRHDMRGTDEKDILKCASCIFRCTEGALKKVKANPDQHIAVTKKSPATLREVYTG